MPIAHKPHPGHPKGPASLNRRMFLGSAALIPGIPATAAAAGGSDEKRAAQAFQTRMQAAQIERNLPNPDHPTNGDEQRYANRIGNYSKGLPHNDLGEVDPSSYHAFLGALATAETSDFERLVMGCPDPARQRKLVNPLSGEAFDLEGADCNHLAIASGARLR
jgi:hypothetical protein